jgi:hypothetical protein
MGDEECLLIGMSERQKLWWANWAPYMVAAVAAVTGAVLYVVSSTGSIARDLGLLLFGTALSTILVNLTFDGGRWFVEGRRSRIARVHLAKLISAVDDAVDDWLTEAIARHEAGTLTAATWTKFRRRTSGEIQRTAERIHYDLQIWGPHFDPPDIEALWSVDAALQFAVKTVIDDKVTLTAKNSLAKIDALEAIRLTIRPFREALKVKVP